MSVVYTDTFTISDVNPLTTPWTTTTGVSALQVVSNKARPSTAAGPRCGSRYGSFSIANMKTTLTLSTFTSNVQAGPAVRQSSSAYTNYMVQCGGEFQLVKNIGGAQTELAITSGNAPAAGDVVALEAIGTTLNVYKNGVQILQSTGQTDIATGTWAVDASAFSPAIVGNVEIDNIILEAYQPFFVVAGTEGSAASGNITPGTPGGTDPLNLKANDILIMAYHGSDQVAVTVDAAWNLIAQANGSGTTSRLGVWWHRYDGSNFPSALITHASGTSPIAGIGVFRNCPPSNTPLTAGAVTAGPTDVSIEHATVTPSGYPGALLLAINGSADDNDRTLLAGYANVFFDTTINAFITTAGNPDGSVSMFYKLAPITAASGTVTVTQAASDAWASVLVSLEVLPQPWVKSLSINQSLKRAANY